MAVNKKVCSVSIEWIFFIAFHLGLPSFIQHQRTCNLDQHSLLFEIACAIVAWLSTGCLLDVREHSLGHLFARYQNQPHDRTAWTRAAHNHGTRYIRHVRTQRCEFTIQPTSFWPASSGTSSTNPLQTSGFFSANLSLLLIERDVLRRSLNLEKSLKQCCT